MADLNPYDDINEGQAWNRIITDDPDHKTLTCLANSEDAVATDLPEEGGEYHSFSIYSPKPIYWTVTSLAAVNDSNNLKCKKFEGGRFGLTLKSGFKQVYVRPVNPPTTDFEVLVTVG